MKEVIIDGVKYVPEVFKVEFNASELKIIDEIAEKKTMTRTQVVMYALAELYHKN